MLSRRELITIEWLPFSQEKLISNNQFLNKTFDVFIGHQKD